MDIKGKTLRPTGYKVFLILLTPTALIRKPSMVILIFLLVSSVKHEAFMICTSKGKRDKEGFELFITTAPIPDLNKKLHVFGRVIKGEDVVQVIT